MKKSRFTDSHIMAVLNQSKGGTPVPDLCRKYGISSVTFYKRRTKIGNRDVSLMVKMKEREKENRRLMNLYVDAQMRAWIVEETLAKK